MAAPGLPVEPPQYLEQPQLAGSQWVAPQDVMAAPCRDAKVMRMRRAKPDRELVPDEVAVAKPDALPKEAAEQAGRAVRLKLLEAKA